MSALACDGAQWSTTPLCKLIGTAAECLAAIVVTTNDAEDVTRAAALHQLLELRQLDMNDSAFGNIVRVSLVSYLLIQTI